MEPTVTLATALGQIMPEPTHSGSCSRPRPYPNKVSRHPRPAGPAHSSSPFLLLASQSDFSLPPALLRGSFPLTFTSPKAGITSMD